MFNSKEKIYLDYQATTPVDSRVLAAMLPYFSEIFGNPHSSEHIYGWESSSAVDRAASSVASLLGFEPNGVVFTSGATESNNLALKGLKEHGLKVGRNSIFVAATEHKCVLASARALQQDNRFNVQVIPVNSYGQVDFEWLKNKVDDQTLLVSVMAVNNEIGTIADLKSVADIVQASGALLHTDAAQAPVAMVTRELSSLADLVSISGHKMFGPKGIGALLVSHECSSYLTPQILGGGQQSGLRSGTVPTPLAVGLGVAAELLTKEWDEAARASLRRKTQLLWNYLKEYCDSIELNGPPIDERHPGNLSVRFKGVIAADLLLRMQPTISASSGSACASGIEEPSHVLTAIGLSHEAASESVRFSVGPNTKKSEIEFVAQFIGEILRKIKH